AERVSAARAKAGQPLLSFILPAWQREPSAPVGPSAGPATPAVAAPPADLLSLPPAPPGPACATIPPPPGPASGNRGPHPIARLHGREASGSAADEGRSGERPRLAGPHTPGGDPVMEGTDTKPLVIAGGEKAKSRDILAAIRTLQLIER